VDAGVVVSALVDERAVGEWAERVLATHDLVAPHLMPFEVANVLQRSSLAGDISDDVASIAHAQMAEFSVELVPYSFLDSSAWRLRDNVTIYDASYVALAEFLDAPLATLDARLARAPGVGCRLLLPE